MGIAERRAREREARRQSVLDAARELVRERGFHGTTTRQIAEACELSEATLFFYFKSKEEIFTSLLFEAIAFMAAGLDELAAERGPVRERLRGLWSFFARVREEHPEYFLIFTHLAQPGATGQVSAEVRAEILARSAENFRQCARLVQELTGLNQERARRVADLLWGAFLGLVVLRDSRVNLGASPRPDPADLEDLLDLLLAALPGEARP